MKKKEKKNEKKEEKWKTAHEAAAEILEEAEYPTIDILTITKLYGEKRVKVPPEGIPRLKKALERWKEEAPAYEENIVLALSNLEQQEKEEKEKKKD